MKRMVVIIMTVMCVPALMDVTSGNRGRGCQAQTGRRQCPVVTVSCPDMVDTGAAPLQFVATVSNSEGLQLTYNWTVSAGTIADGQGSPTISIDTTGLGSGQSITATVEVGGLPPDCLQASSCTFVIQGAAPQPMKFDEYGKLNFNDENKRLREPKGLIEQLQSKPYLWVYFIIYRNPCDTEKMLKQRGETIRGLLDRSGIEPGRIIVKEGGVRSSSLLTEVYLALPQAVAPMPTPSGPARCKR